MRRLKRVRAMHSRGGRACKRASGVKSRAVHLSLCGAKGIARECARSFDTRLAARTRITTATATATPTPRTRRESVSMCRQSLCACAHATAKNQHCTVNKYAVRVRLRVCVCVQHKCRVPFVRAHSVDGVNINSNTYFAFHRALDARPHAVWDDGVVVVVIEQHNTVVFGNSRICGISLAYACVTTCRHLGHSFFVHTLFVHIQ